MVPTSQCRRSPSEIQSFKGKRMKISTGTVIGALLGIFLSGLPAQSQTSDKTTVYLNESYVEETQREPEFAIDNPTAVFGVVFDSLPSSVKVYPTEGYYYFSFHYRGIRYAGNIRFDIADRDQGVIHFNYFKEFTDWQRDESGYSVDLSRRDGIALTPAGKLAYDLEYKGRKVRFQLNDLSDHRPPPGLVLKGETYIGPVFDESGMRFFLLFHQEAKTFLFVLDETVPVADQFDTIENVDRITNGIRTGFAFYSDRYAKRKILVGVSQLNTSINNYLDGPFDQLPDNFIVGDTLKNAILAASPEMEGQVDRFGNSPDGESRYLIAPYMQYEEPAELSLITDCTAEKVPPAYYGCFFYTGGDESDDAPPGDDAAKPKDTDTQDQKTEKPADQPSK
jgi:hypothetical protein